MRSARNRLSPDTSPSHEGRNPKVFLSHAASDEHIALLLKAEVERRLPGVKVFCSSDPADLPPEPSRTRKFNKPCKSRLC